MQQKYKAAYLSAPHDLNLREVDVPRIEKDQALIRVKTCSICGSDIECYGGESKEGRYDIAPYVPGHEWSGEVLDVGKNVTALKKGDKVTSDCVLQCGNCYNCKSGLSTASCLNFREVGFRPDSPGGMAELFVLEEKNLHRLPDDFTWEEGALVEPFSVSYFTIWGDGGYVDASDNVVIFGAGPIGLLSLVVSKVAGARVIVVEPVEFRRAFAARMGADEVINNRTENVKDRVMELTQGRGANLVVEASGDDEAIAFCFDVAAFSARIRLVGHSIGRKVAVEIGLTIWKGLFIHGQAGAPYFLPQTIRSMSRVKKQIDLSQLITHRFPLEKIQDGFEWASRGKKESIKVMLTM